MARTDLYRDSFNNIKKYVDDLFHKIQKGTGDMLKSVYDKNHNGKVDISESVSLDQKPQSVTETEIKFGVDANGKWGYIKGGADTVTPFKGDPNLQSKTASASTSVQTIMADSGYDGLSSVTINAATKQSKTVSPSTSQQVITPDSGYYGLSEVEVNAIPSQGMFEYTFPNRTVSITTNGRHGYSAQTAYDSQTEGYYEGYSLSSGSFTIDVNVPTAAVLQSKTVSPTTSQQIVEPDAGYDGLEQVTVNAVSLQSKSVTGMTPSANWSGAYTNAYSISPDSGYTGMSSVSVTVPMVRDYSLFTVSTVETPSTVYNGDTAQSNSTKMLRIAPTKTGMVYTNSYLELGPSSYMGNATAADVLSGKTFSSSNGIQLTGTNPGGSTPTGNINLGTFTTNGSKTGYNVSGYATCSFTVSVPQPSGTYSYGSITANGSKSIYVKDYEYISFTVSVPTGGSLESNRYTDSLWKGSKEVLPSSGYDGMSKIKIYGIKSSTTLIWQNINGTGDNFGAQTITLSQSYKKFSAILIEYWPNKNAGSSVEYLNWIMGTDEITVMNNTSSNSFVFAGRAVTSPGASSGTNYARYFRFPTETTMYITTANQCGGTGSSSGVLIPTFIYGIP